MLGHIDWAAVIAVAILGTLQGVAMANLDRFPGFMNTLAVEGAVVALASVGYFVVVQPRTTIVFLGLFLLGNLMLGFQATSAYFRPKPADSRAHRVWADEVAWLRRQGWRHVATWVLDYGQTQPVYTIMARDDGTKVEMLGTNSNGGRRSVETLLNDGRGAFITHHSRSLSMRHPWLLRQDLKGATLPEMLCAHDEGLRFLRARGIAITGAIPGDPEDLVRAYQRKARQSFKRRWWLWMVRPIALLLQPSSKGPIQDQAAIDRQLEGYFAAIGSEKPMLTIVSEMKRDGRVRPGVR